MDGDFTGQKGIEFADSASLDAFGRLRTSLPVGIFENKNIQSKRPVIWSEIIEGVILEHGSVTAGPFQVGETVTGGTSGQTGVVNVVNAGDLNLDTNHNDFEVSETITGGTSGASAVLTSTDTGGDIQHMPNQASAILTVGQLNGDRTIRQTLRYIPYVPGKSQQITMTFSMGAAETDVIRRAGFFDDENGIFLEQTDADIAFVVRSSVTGSPTEVRKPQSEWNVDKLDGSGKSRVTLDLSKSQIMSVDFQWLGVGRVRLGFSIDGMTVYAHEFLNSNVLPGAYMSSPTLPLRYEVTAAAALASTATTREICCAVSSEGGFVPPGFEFSVSMEWNERSITTFTPLIAIRLKDAFSAEVTNNRRTAKFIDAGFITRTNDTLFHIQNVHEPSGITATWTDVGQGSGVEFSDDITAVTGNPVSDIDHRYVPSGQGSFSEQGEVEAFAINAHSFISQNFTSDNSEILMIAGDPRTGTSNVAAHITWVEFE